MQRHTTLLRLADETFDVLVIGGGVTGAGVALDASLRGLRVALVERDDFASGTSSRSSKLIHGGLRYLRRLHLGQVREGLRERRILEALAPHLVLRTPFLFPSFGGPHLGVRAGLELYDVLASGTGFPRHRRVARDEVASLAPTLRATQGALEYWDARTDDARLVWTIVRTALERGAAVANHAAVTSLVIENDRVAGATVDDRETASLLDVRARVVVNATGVWADEVRALEGERSHEIRPSKGIHLVFPASRIPLQSALILPTPDRRFLFVVPWENSTVLVGTTDDDYTGPLDAPGAEPEEIDWILGVVNEALAEPVGLEDIVSTFAGLRPLVGRLRGRTKDASRRPVVEVGRSGMVTTTGGKLTSWRPMAARTVDKVLKVGRFADRRPSKTSETRLAGAAFYEGVVPALEAVLDDLRLDRAHAPRLYHRYGSHAAEVLRLVRDDASLGEALHPELPYLRAEADYAIAVEGSCRPDDVLARRLRATLTSRDGGRAALKWVCDRLAVAHGWTSERYEREINRHVL